MAIDKETVKFVAYLARLRLNEEELDLLSGQLKSIVDFVDKLKELEVTAVAATSHILPASSVFRQDALCPSLSSQEALENAPQKKNGFFVVPKIIE